MRPGSRGAFLNCYEARMRRTLLLLPALLLSTGCLHELRGNSHRFLPPAASQRVINEPLEQASRHVLSLFGRRQVSLIDRRTGRNGSTLLVMAGNRTAVTSVESYNYGYGFRQSQVYSEPIGSVFYAELSALSPMQSQVLLFGKPTVNKQTVCTNFDPVLNIPCNGVTVPGLWGGYNVVTGQDEAELIRGVLAELELSSPPPQGPPPPESPSAPPPLTNP